MNDLNRHSCKNLGTGPEKSVCLIMIVCGLGDDLHALPAVQTMLAEGYELTVYCRAFHVPIWEAIGVQRVIAEEKESNLGLQWVHANHHKFGAWYSLRCWGGWEVDALGYSYRSQFEQFAEIVDAKLPDTFSWIDVLKPARSYGQADYLLFAPESAEVWRTLPKWKQAECVAALEGDNIVWLTAGRMGGQHTSWQSFPELRDKMTVCSTWHELSNLVYNASAVLSVESGISNLARAYELPLTVMSGPTECTHILGQYARYLPNSSYEEIRGVQPEGGICQMPCFRHPERGMFDLNGRGERIKGGHCCGVHSHPECLAEISIEQVLESLKVLS